MSDRITESLSYDASDFEPRWLAILCLDGSVGESGLGILTDIPPELKSVSIERHSSRSSGILSSCSVVFHNLNLMTLSKRGCRKGAAHGFVSSD